jgi:hypothetical protein
MKKAVKISAILSAALFIVVFLTTPFHASALMTHYHTLARNTVFIPMSLLESATGYVITALSVAILPWCALGFEKILQLVRKNVLSTARLIVLNAALFAGYLAGIFLDIKIKEYALNFTIDEHITNTVEYGQLFFYKWSTAVALLAGVIPFLLFMARKKTLPQ